MPREVGYSDKQYLRSHGENRGLSHLVFSYQTEFLKAGTVLGPHEDHIPLSDQWLRLHAAKVEGTASIPGWGTKIPIALQCGQKKRFIAAFQAGDPGSFPGQHIVFFILLGLPGDSDGKESSCNEGDLGLIPGLGRSPGEGNGYPLQYSGLENCMDRGAWQATVHRVAKSWTGLSDFHFHTYIRGTYIYRTFVTREKVFITGDTNYSRKSVCSVTQLCLTLFDPMD